MALKRLGAKKGMAHAGSHASVQKRVDAPSPTSTVIEQANKEEVIRSGVHGRRAQAESGLVRRNHSHLRCSANPRTFRSGMPSPP